MSELDPATMLLERLELTSELGLVTWRLRAQAQLALVMGSLQNRIVVIDAVTSLACDFVARDGWPLELCFAVNAATGLEISLRAVLGQHAQAEADYEMLTKLLARRGGELELRSDGATICWRSTNDVADVASLITAWTDAASTIDVTAYQLGRGATERLQLSSLLQQELDQHREVVATLNTEVDEANKGLLALDLELEGKRPRDRALQAANAKAEFLANVSHEIRTPLNGVIGMNELLLQSELDTDQRELAEAAQRAGQDLLVIVNDVLDFSKIEAGRLELERVEFDLQDLIDDVAELLARQANAKRLELVGVVGAGVPVIVEGDPVRLRQVLTNLVGNAIKFTNDGSVTIRVTRDEEIPGAVRFSVTDTGIGIPKDRQASVFEAFTQADTATTRRFGGTGLGLVISQRLVELMGGTISLDSTPDVGSEFFFSIALTGRASDLVALDRATIEQTWSLVVDDQDVNREVLRQHLARWGLRSEEVSTPEQALQRIQQAKLAKHLPALVFLDYYMPTMNGLELARLIHGDPDLASVRMILLSSLGVERFADEELAACGISAQLPRPVRHSQLFNVVMNVLGVPPTSAERTRHFDLRTGERRLRARILLAEDNVVNQKVAIGLLEHLGYRVHTVANGREAVEEVERDDFVAVLMDCQMPELDGYEATKEIRRREPPGVHVPIIALTASAMTHEEERCRAAGMDDFLAKPIHSHDLDTMLARYLPPASTQLTEDESGVLRRDQLESLARLGPGKSFVVDLLDTFKSESRALLEHFSADIEKGDVEHAQRQLHNLKGSAGYLGAARVGELCEMLETSLPQLLADRVATRHRYLQLSSALETFLEHADRVVADLDAP